MDRFFKSQPVTVSPRQTLSLCPGARHVTLPYLGVTAQRQGVGRAQLNLCDSMKTAWRNKSSFGNKHVTEIPLCN